MRDVSFEGLLELKMNPYELFKLLYLQILIRDQSNCARFNSERKKPFNGLISAKLVIMTLF